MLLKNIIKLALIQVSICTFIPQANSSDQTDSAWKKLLGNSNIPINNQAYCYTDEKGKLLGENLDLRIRLASVSKLFTSLWAVEKLGPNFKYETKLFIKGNKLHIKGSMDPFLGNEKMFFLVSQLNELGYTKFETITFDKTIQINPGAEIHTDEYPLITRASNARNLKNYFNTKLWSAELKAEYKRVRELAPKGKFRENVQFEIADAQFSEQNPYENDNETRMLTLSSPVLHKYLKEINVKSNNYASHTIFLKLGGVEGFEKFLAETYNLTTDSIRFFTGSGLPVVTEGVRQDNYATCSVSMELMKALRDSAERQEVELSDIAAVPGSDGGTFRNRTFPADFKNSFVAKTGTLMHTSTLAGAMSTQKGFSYYGIFNQSTDIAGSKIVQNGMVKSIMMEMGGPLVFNYEVDPFHSYNGDKVKNLLDYDFMIPDSFNTIDQDLF